jgi:Tfp pilus assembly protein PilF
VARAIAGEIRATLTPPQQARLAGARRVDPEAYEAYLKGRQECAKYTNEGFEKGIAYFQQAILKDPGFAASQAALAECFCWAALHGVAKPIAVFPKARAAATKALELDETLAEAHAALGAVTFLFDWDFRGAEKEFRRAVELNPNSASARDQYGVYLVFLGRFDEGIAEMTRAQALDPASAAKKARSGLCRFIAGRHDEAIADYRKALELDPKLSYVYAHLAWVYARKGLRSEAIATGEKARKLLAPGKDLAFDAFLAEIYVQAGRRAEVLRWVELWESLPAERYVDGYILAFMHSVLGNRNRAFQWLNRAYEERASGMPALKTDPWWDTLRSDPRFQDLLRRVGFPE